jgi:hypothetical protein
MRRVRPAALAGLAVALLAFLRWLREPGTKQALIFGAAFERARDIILISWMS